MQSRDSYLRRVLHAIQHYGDTREPAPGYNAYIIKDGMEDRFYDDNQWVGIACMDAYFRTKNDRYLEEGKKVYRFMMTGYDTVAGGGLYWKEHDPSTKNTCSNGPGVLLALQLYNATKEKSYVDTALMLYDWATSKLRSPEGVYYDNVMLPSGKIDKRTYTYNTGTMMQSAVMLYEILKNPEYLREAKELAKGSLAKFYRNGRWPRNYWFNAVLLRGYQHLLKHDKEPKYVNAFFAEGERVWKEERDANNLLGTDPKKHLLEQAAMLEIYARLGAMRG
jgi:hypothetical protein